MTTHLEQKNKNKNFVWNAIGLTLNAFTSLIFLVIVKLVNGLDDAGIFTYAFALGCLFFILAIYYNRSYQVSDHKNQFSFNEYFSCRLITSILSIVLVVIFSLINQFDFYKILVILLIVVFRAIEAISDCFYGAIQKNGELYKTGISYTIKTICGVLLFLIIDLLTHNLLFALIALILVSLVVLVKYDFPNYQRYAKGKLTFRLTKVRSILKICFPVFIFSALSIYLMNCQKYVLTYFAPNDVQTIFGILIMPATFLSLIGSYLINPFMNKMTALSKKHLYDHFCSNAAKIIGVMVLGGALCSIACWFLGIPILNIIYDMDLSAYQYDLLWIIIAAVFYAITMIFSSFLTILKANLSQSIVYSIVAVIATILSLIFIPKAAITGSVLSFLISGIILTVLYLGIFVFTIKSLKKKAKI